MPSQTPGQKFEQLLALMARLRAPGGCPWDREQTFDSIKAYTLEETYEVLDAIERRDWAGLCEELGDFLLQAVFYAEMAAEQQHFSIADSLDAINEKLVRRHPHVFGTGEANTADEVKQRWDEIKAREKQSSPANARPLLQGVPRNLPALMEAQQLTSKAAKVGFDWERPEQIVEKLHEELGELEQARGTGDRDRLEDELGDLFFVLVNLSRQLKVDPEQALRRTNGKFRQRFGYLEAKLREQGKALEEAGLNEMEALWQQAKRAEL